MYENSLPAVNFLIAYVFINHAVYDKDTITHPCVSTERQITTRANVQQIIFSEYAITLWRHCCRVTHSLNTLGPKQNGCHFADDTFKHIFLNENVRISIKISLKFVSKGPINKIPSLVQIMAWRQTGTKPLSEPMMVRLPTHICVTRPNPLSPSIFSTDPSPCKTYQIHIEKSIWENSFVKVCCKMSTAGG